MTIRKEWRKMTYKNYEFDVYFHTWVCNDTREQFEDDLFANLNYNQAISQYKNKFI